MPCNARLINFDYDVNGPALIVTEDGDVVRGRINREGADSGYTAHWATCPDAAKFRNTHSARNQKPSEGGPK